MGGEDWQLTPTPDERVSSFYLSTTREYAFVSVTVPIIEASLVLVESHALMAATVGSLAAVEAPVCSTDGYLRPKIKLRGGPRDGVTIQGDDSNSHCSTTYSVLWLKLKTADHMLTGTIDTEELWLRRHFLYLPRCPCPYHSPSLPILVSLTVALPT